MQAYPYLVEFPMKFTAVPGSAPVFGLETIDLALLTLAVPALLAMFIGLRKDYGGVHRRGPRRGRGAGALNRCRALFIQPEPGQTRPDAGIQSLTC